jgi:hypothetical protein
MNQGRAGRDAPSMVGTGGAMRARDVSRPDAAELDAAERELTIAFKPASERPKRPKLEDPSQRSSRPR